MTKPPRFFKTSRAWRGWLEKHHTSSDELAVGFYTKGSGKASITWPESVDQALCFGWIDGVRRNIDSVSYQIRFTPRKPSSNWSSVNIARVEELISTGEMTSAGLAAYRARQEGRSGVYAYENRKSARLTPDFLARFEASSEGWKFFSGQPNGYRANAIWWVISAKQASTRERRLDQLIEDSAAGRRIKQFRPLAS